MTKTITLAAMLLSAAALALSGAATAGDSKHHEHSGKHDKPGHQHADGHAAQHSDEDSDQHNEIHIELSSRMQQLNNITTEVAGKRTLVQNTALFGVIKAMPT